MQKEAFEGQVVVFRYALVSEPTILKAPNWDLDEFAGLRPPRDGDRPQNVDIVREGGTDMQRIERWMPMVVMGGQDRTYRSPIAKPWCVLPSMTTPDALVYWGADGPSRPSASGIG